MKEDNMTTEAGEILAQLRAAAARRSQASRHTLEGLQVRSKALEDLRAYGAKGRRLGLTQEQMYTAAGLGHTQWNKIMNGRVLS